MAHIPDQPTSQYPLAGLKVVELSTMITCSLAAMTLRAQGAQVVKVEPTAFGDAMRLIGTQKGGVSTLFNNCNRGKRSLAIDLKTDAGRHAVTELAKQADILLLDEPFAGMDAELQTRLIKTLRELWQQKLVLLVSHDLEQQDSNDTVHHL